MKNYILPSFVMLVLSGCGSIGIGDEPEDCGEGKAGVGCVSARQIISATNTHTNLEGMTTEEVKKVAYENDPSSYKNVNVPSAAPEKKADKNQEPAQPANQPLSAAERSAAYGRFQEERLHLPSPDPLAVRNTPDILRVTFAPYIDENDRLNMPSQAFIEVEKRQWIIGEKASSKVYSRTPTAVRALSVSASQAAQSKPKDGGGMGVETRQPQNEYNFEAILPPGTPMPTVAPQFGN